MNQLAERDVEQAARAAAGNWRDFECFCWFRQSDLLDPDQFAIVYTHHRDSGLLDQSNASVIEKALEPFTEGDDPDVVPESHNHWAVGWIDGYSIRVYRNGEITEAFRVYHKLARRMDDYPILDEEDYSNREYEATFENIGEAAWRLKDDWELPDQWEGDVYSWLSDHRCCVIESRDDQGGWPEEDDLEAAFTALGYSSVA